MPSWWARTSIASSRRTGRTGAARRARRRLRAPAVPRRGRGREGPRAPGPGHARRERRAGGERRCPRERLVEEATAELVALVVGSTLTTVVVFVPLGVLSGV